MGAGERPARRPTMADIARRAGVTKGAVSFALNGRPGVSEATRARVLAIAEESGWQPNSAARALSHGRAGSFGPVVDPRARPLGTEPSFMQLVSGIQDELSGDGTALLPTAAPGPAAGTAVHRAWWAQRRVDGVFLVDLRLDDPRVSALEELRMPAVVIGGSLGPDGPPAVWSDEARAMRTALTHLADLGHRSVAHVTGPAGPHRTAVRAEAFASEARRLGIAGTTAEADHGGGRDPSATRALLERGDRPSAILYDNDAAAVSGPGAAQRLGVRVPEELSLVSWDDSPLCELVHPGLTALRRDVAAHGAHAARRLRDAAAGRAAGDLRVPDAVLAVRGSTAAPAGGAQRRSRP